ncbi:MAG TPA: hypothetical protein VFZ53_14755 [Polyangiaceae bacterium]
MAARSLVLGFSLALASCSGSASAPAALGSASSPCPGPPVPVEAPASSAATSSASAPPAPVPPPPPPASAAAPDAAPPLVGPDGAPLPQTEDRPSVASAWFRENVELVARAILSGEPAPAHRAFFPLVAYRQVKAIKDPERDYERRLLAAFDADVREYHRALGKNLAGVTFAGIDVPEARAEWMKPGREGNKVGYHRVLRSKLRFMLPSGKERSFELTSMISWRGEWYVVHLSGFD